MVRPMTAISLLDENSIMIVIYMWCVSNAILSLFPSDIGSTQQFQEFGLIVCNIIINFILVPLSIIYILSFWLVFNNDSGERSEPT